MRRFITAALLLWAPVMMAQNSNLFRGANVAVSSWQENYPAENAVDGRMDRASTWMSNRWKTAPHIIEVTLPHYSRIDSIVIVSGIPESELKPAEKQKAAGFWCMQNFIVQYWDDANWTDLTETSVTENRLEKVVFHFRRPVTSFKFRLVCHDGGPVRLRELEGYGVVDKSIPDPVITASSSLIAPVRERTDMDITVKDEVIGKSLQYVAYNQGYFVPGGNAPAWWEYSNANAARLWADLKTYVLPEWLSGEFPAADTQAQFEANRKKFLEAPERYMPMDSVAAMAHRVIESTNTMSFEYALETLKGLGVDVLVQSGIDRDYYQPTWQRKWELWQRFYTLASYAAAKGNMSMMALCNEPNHRNAGPMPLDSWLEMAAVAADALHAAVPGAKFVGPVTAGTNANWWAEVAASDIADLFSTHSYNIPANGYIGRVSMIDDIYRKNHPRGETRPVVFTETGRWMNAYLIDKEETMDSPSLFTEWAGMYVKNMLEGCYGMWAFKFATTVSSTYPWGIKSGHHIIWRGRRFLEDSFENYALGAKVTPDAASVLVDGNKSTAWVAEGSAPKTVTLDLGKTREIGGVAVYSGSEGGLFTAPDRARSMKLEYRTPDGKWEAVKDLKPAFYKYAQVYYELEPAVSADAVRLTVLDDGLSKLREIKVFPAGSISSSEQCHDVSGVQRTAEVVRLFAKGFKQSRPIYLCDTSFADREFDVAVAKDPSCGNLYVWLVQRNPFSYNLNLDLRTLGVKAGDKVVAECVSADSYGEAKLLTISSDGHIYTSVPSQSVTLLTITPSQAQSVEVKAKSCFSVNMASSKVEKKALAVEMNAHDAASNDVAYISYDLSSQDIASASRILLSVEGVSNAADHQRLHVYCFDGTVRPSGMYWKKAPHLDASESRITGVGTDCYVAGEITMNPEKKEHCLDVTEVVRKHFSEGVTFVIAREAREYGDDYDNGIRSTLDSKSAKLIIW